MDWGCWSTSHGENGQAAGWLADENECPYASTSIDFVGIRSRFAAVSFCCSAKRVGRGFDLVSEKTDDFAFATQWRMPVGTIDVGQKNGSRRD